GAVRCLRSVLLQGVDRPQRVALLPEPAGRARRLRVAAPPRIGDGAAMASTGRSTDGRPGRGGFSRACPACCGSPPRPPPAAAAPAGVARVAAAAGGGLHTVAGVVAARTGPVAERWARALARPESPR